MFHKLLFADGESRGHWGNLAPPLLEKHIGEDILRLGEGCGGPLHGPLLQGRGHRQNTTHINPQPFLEI